MLQIKPIVLIVGKSGSGKTAVANYLEKNYSLVQLSSYTTRNKRFNSEKGHLFVSKEEYFKIPNKIATTYFNGNYYCSTKEQVDNSDLYVVDFDGVFELLKKYKGIRPIKIIYINAHWFKRFWRMIKRGDGILSAVKRIWNDKLKFKNFKDIPHLIDEEFECGSSAQIGDSIYVSYFKM